MTTPPEFRYDFYIMAFTAMAISLLFLLMIAGFCLGWIVPLIIGLVRRKKGKPAKVLIIVSSVWGGLAVLGIAFIAACVFAALRATESYRVPTLTMADYDGATGTLSTGHSYEASLTARTEDGSQYSFTAKEGTFTVPAGTLTPTSYSISKQDDADKKWTLSWYFYGSKEKRIHVDDGGTTVLNWGEPITLKVTRKGLSGGTQRIGLQMLDAHGNQVRISSHKTPQIQIIDEAGEVLWTRKMEYG